MRALIRIAGILALLLQGSLTARAAEDNLRAYIGQMIIVGFEGTSTKDDSFRKLIEKVRNGHVSGILYLKRNLSSGESVTDMNATLQRAAPTPIFIAIDQEGGAIQRIPDGLGFPRTPSARTVAGKLSPRKAYEAYSALARALHSWGFNLNLGPVADLDVNPNNPIIGKLGRSFSSDPDTVVQYSAAFVDAHRRYSVLTSLKHFPGHGSAEADSHDRFVDVTKTSTPSELAIFKELVHDEFADLVMVGHTYDAKLQPVAKLPATLDRAVVTGLLREKIGYNGVVITDDLQMAAVSDHFSLRDIVVKAVLAGNDLLVFGNSKNVDPDIDRKITDILVEEAARDPKLRAAIGQAAKRIATLKKLQAGAVDPISTRSVIPGGQYLTPDFVRSQARATVLIPAF